MRAFLFVLTLMVGGCSSAEQKSVPNTETAQPGDTAGRTGTDAMTASGAGPVTESVIITETEYYSTGPQQSRPPDGKLPVGTKVRIVNDGGSYVQIESADGLQGWVSADTVGTGTTSD
ncbi:MAG: SH3 domain-containing protein [Fuerstiella sp.]|nr:SH3 domain-containing protein [Fuerstiella sp.]